ncbi:hypothetical protein CDAR_530851 [Caerostris darwini]|uniref:Ribosomal protein S2 n=1 Tax=Caerostris darwini TaxID=1538125 RepID=A0AAV4VTG4_9ARAC|nr:hypothetical protein CDAR_530851 [Caerostris darwini]
MNNAKIPHRTALARMEFAIARLDFFGFKGSTVLLVNPNFPPFTVLQGGKDGFSPPQEKYFFSFLHVPKEKIGDEANPSASKTAILCPIDLTPNSGINLSIMSTKGYLSLERKRFL